MTLALLTPQRAANILAPHHSGQSGGNEITVAAPRRVDSAFSHSAGVMPTTFRNLSEKSVYLADPDAWATFSSVMPASMFSFATSICRATIALLTVTPVAALKSLWNWNFE